VNTVSTVPPPGAGLALLHRQFNRLLDETARLSETDQAPDSYYREFLQRVLTGTGAVAGTVWSRSAAGPPRVEAEVNLEQVGLDADADGRQRHDELIRQAIQTARPLVLAPHSGSTTAAPDAGAAAGNPTGYVLLLAPILIEMQIVGLVEVWREPSHGADAQAAFLPFLVGMAHYASIYARNKQRRQLAVQQDLWVRLEAFSRQLHGSLDLARVAYTIANDGRQLVGGDRISVVGRCGRKAVVEAVSDVDVIDRRANQVVRLRRLAERVLAWGEPLVYRGSRDDRLPPGVLRALDAYLAESRSTLLVVQPLREDSQEHRPRFALVLECFEPVAAPEPVIARLEVVGRHAAGALGNAATHQRIPLRWLWRPLAVLQDGLGGRAAALGMLIAAVVVGLVAAMVYVPYPLKMEAAGQLLPRERRWLYSPVPGQVVRFEQGVQPGGAVAEGQALVQMYDTQLELKLVELAHEIAGARDEIAALAVQLNTAKTEADRAGFAAEKRQKEFLRDRKLAELKALRERTHADEARPGHFWLTAPLAGTVLDWDFREKLTHRSVRPSDPLLRIGDRDRGWEVELKIPHRHVGQVLEAFAGGDAAAELDVDLLVLSAPTRVFKGKLARQQLAAAASPDRDGDGAEPVVRAAVRLDGPDIAEADRIPRDLLVSGTEVHAKIRCGDCRLGYGLFYGVWEWFYEKVLFF
jgi:hypothetical protein